MSPPVIVLGMHRSGTSLVTGCLEAAGLFLGEVNTSAPSNRKGNRENEGLRACHDRMLASRGHDWKTPPSAPLEWTSEETAMIRAKLADYGERSPWGFKDPRTIWLIEGYLGLFPEARLIAPFRHPSAVAKSLASRPPSLALSVAEGLALWRVTNRKLLDLAETMPVTLLRFSGEGLRDPLFSRPMSRFVREVGLPKDWRDFYDGTLLHHDAADADGAEPGEEDLGLWQALNARADTET